MPRRTLTGASVLETMSFCPSIEDGVSFAEDELRPKRSGQAAKKLGLLSTLPLELAQDIFTILDFTTLDTLISISPEAQSILDSIPAYRKLAENVPHLLRALTELHSAPHITIEFLTKDLLARKTCSNCGAFAGYYSLLLDRRCCKNCIKADDEFEAWIWEDCSEHFQIDKELLSLFKSVRPVRGGYYGVEGGEYVPKEGEILVPAEKIRSKAGEIHGHFREELMFQEWLAKHPAGAYRASSVCGNRFACAVRIPWFRPDGEVEWGVGCKLCLDGQSVGFRLQASNPWSNVLFSKAEFKEHLETDCRYMRDIEAKAVEEEEE